MQELIVRMRSRGQEDSGDVGTPPSMAVGDRILSFVVYSDNGEYVDVDPLWYNGHLLIGKRVVDYGPYIPTTGKMSLTLEGVTEPLMVESGWNFRVSRGERTITRVVVEFDNGTYEEFDSWLPWVAATP